MEPFLVIGTDDEDCIDSHGQRVDAFCASDAAEDYAEMHWSNNDCAERQEISVKATSGEIKRFEVVAEPSVTFNAHEVKSGGAPCP